MAEELDLPKELEELSKKLSKLLRHTGRHAGLNLDNEVWCSLAELRSYKRMHRWSEDQLLETIEKSINCGQHRFENREKDGIIYVRATYKRSFTGSSGSGTSVGAGKSCKERKRKYWENWSFNDETGKMRKMESTGWRLDTSASRLVPAASSETPDNNNQVRLQPTPHGSASENDTYIAKDERGLAVVGADYDGRVGK